jgi:hypothetical protein
MSMVQRRRLSAESEDEMEKPILFSTPMVRAILDGKKTMTRRVIKPQSQYPPMQMAVGYHAGEWHEWRPADKADIVTGSRWGAQIKCPYGKPGDILWVRETWCDPTSDQSGYPILYKADMPMHWDANETEHGEEVTLRAEDYKWRSSMFMPKEVCRIKLKITDIRAERLRDITEKDAKAEGIRSYWAEPHEDTSPFVGAAKELGMDLCFTRVEAFQQLWDFLNLKRGYGWNTNPWVWVVCFEKVAP